MKIIAKVDDQHIVITAGANISNSVNLYTVNYNFSDDWEGYEKIACFEYTDVGVSEKQIAYVTISENEAVVPWEALQTAGYIRLGVYGIKGTEKKPTVWSQPLSVIQGCRLGNDIDPESSTYEDLIKRLAAKQDTLTAGKNITIENNVISSTGGGGSDLEAGDNITIKDGVISAIDTTYTAGENITIDENNVISSTDTIYDDSEVVAAIEVISEAITNEIAKREQSEQSLAEALNTEVQSREKDVADLAQKIIDETTRATKAEENKQDKLTAGENIKIEENVISSTDTIYDDSALKTQIQNIETAKQNKLIAGSNITIDENNVISSEGTTYEAGQNITIDGNTINATDTTYAAGDGIDITDNVIKCTKESKTYTAGTGIEISEDGVISCTFEDGNGVTY